MADRQAVVIVEDPDEAEFLGRMLGQAGIDATTVGSTMAALDAVKAGQAGSLVVGMVLGRDSGLDLVQRVRGIDDPERAQLPIVVLAESSRAMDRLKAWERGADTFLTKPFHFDELVDALTSAETMAVEDRRQRRRQLFEAERKRLAEERRR